MIKSAAVYLLVIVIILSNIYISDSFIIHKPGVRLFGSDKKAVSVKASSREASIKRKVLIISPPGNVGEVSAVETALRGGSVYWFIVSSTSGAENIKLSKEIFKKIEKTGGKLEIAGITYNPAPEGDVVLPWCGSGDIDSLICTLDGIDDEDGNKNEWEDAIKLVVKEASSGLKQSNKKVVLLPTSFIEETEEENLLQKLLRKIPRDLIDAVGDDGNICVMRYGQLFGSPDSSVDVFPFEGGPRRDPVIRDEYIMRSVRFEPFVGQNEGIKTRSSRLNLGESASLIALGLLPFEKSQTNEILVTSLRGADKLVLEEYETEFKKLYETTKQLSNDLFWFEFSNVPSVKRLADWIELKWAPSILRSYEIAGIRVGERPVYATRTSDNSVEIIFQTIASSFESVTVGKMIISVTDTSIQATRQANSAQMQGEDILVRSLAEASAQAIEKGLAVKQIVSKPKEIQEVIETKPITTTAAAVAVPNEQPQLETGPKSRGVKRSARRSRGTSKAMKQTVVSESKEEDIDTKPITTKTTTAATVALPNEQPQLETGPKSRGVKRSARRSRETSKAVKQTVVSESKEEVIETEPMTTKTTTAATVELPKEKPQLETSRKSRNTKRTSKKRN